VNTKFFDEPTPVMAFVVGYIWACGSIKTKHRHVLRVTCSPDERYKLNQIQRLLGSQHSIQVYQHQYVLEISNRLLVESFVSRFGLPPSRLADGDPPVLDDGLVAGFAGGHLLGTGYRHPACIRWRGHSSVIHWLSTKIVKLVGVPEPLFTNKTKRISIRWRDQSSLDAINAWLGIH
jgi:hypothetical protein